MAGTPYAYEINLRLSNSNGELLQLAIGPLAGNLPRQGLNLGCKGGIDRHRQAQSMSQGIARHEQSKMPRQAPAVTETG